MSEVIQKQAEHTPGPWEWDEPSNWCGISARVSKSDPYGMIAQVQVSGWKPRSMALANARLIAAAPELFEALLECAEALDFDESAHEFSSTWEMAIVSARKSARDAILKAKGGA